MTEEKPPKVRIPNNDLLDIIKDEFKLKNERALAEFLDVPPPIVSKLRHGSIPFTATYILIVYDATGWSIEKIRGYLPGSSVE